MAGSDMWRVGEVIGARASESNPFSTRVSPTAEPNAEQRHSPRVRELRGR